MGTASDEGFVNKAGLEISGIREGDDSIIKARVKQKLQQTDQSDHTQLEIYVIVVEFGRPLAEVQKKMSALDKFHDEAMAAAFFAEQERRRGNWERQQSYLSRHWTWSLRPLMR